MWKRLMTDGIMTYWVIRLYFGPIETVGRGVVRSSVRSATSVGSSCSAVSPEVTCRLRSAACRCGCGWSQPAGTWACLGCSVAPRTFSLLCLFGGISGATEHRLVWAEGVWIIGRWVPPRIKNFTLSGTLQWNLRIMDTHWDQAFGCPLFGG